MVVENEAIESLFLSELLRGNGVSCKVERRAKKRLICGKREQLPFTHKCVYLMECMELILLTRGQCRS